jgi:hypothetical protein
MVGILELKIWKCKGIDNILSGGGGGEKARFSVLFITQGNG